MYLIEYYAGNELHVTVPNDLPVEKVENAAIIGMIAYLSAGVDFARVLDAKTGAEVNSFKASPEERAKMPLA